MCSNTTRNPACRHARLHHGIDKHRFAIKQIDFWTGHFTVYQNGMPTSASLPVFYSIYADRLHRHQNSWVAPAGYNFTACTKPLSLARRISSGGVLSVKYKVIKGSNCIPAGSAPEYVGDMGCLLCRRHRRFEIRHHDRPRKLCGGVQTVFKASPSRKCKCQSSGRVIVNSWIAEFMVFRIQVDFAILQSE